MGKFFIEFLKLILKICLAFFWGATQLAELILKHLNEYLKSIITNSKH